MNSIRFYHLLNDFSGSPKVLRQVIEKAIDLQQKVYLSTSGGRGFLSDIDAVLYSSNHYRFFDNKLLRLLMYTLVQLLEFVKALFILRKSDVVYINTLLPFGPAFAAKIRGCKVIYHVHECSIKPRILFVFLRFVASFTANELVFVSKFVQEELNLKNPNQRVIYNAIDQKFLDNRKTESTKVNHKPLILMVCSLKRYKGVFEFVRLAELLPQFQFELVLNAKESDVSEWQKEAKVPANLSCHAKQEDLHPFYAKANVVLNLSHPDLWVETFGLTILEAMCYGIPTIVPQVGGIKELVEHGKTAYCLSVKELDQIEKHLIKICSQKDVALKFGNAAAKRAEKFYPSFFNQQLELVLK